MYCVVSVVLLHDDLIMSLLYLDLCTVDVDDDNSMATEQMEPLRADRVPAPPVKKEKTPQQQKQEKQPVNPKAKGGRVKGREGHVSTPERKPIHKQPVYIPREDIKKKKGLELQYLSKLVCYSVFGVVLLYFYF